MTELTKRRDFAVAVEVIDSNPNGDPDNGNRPRIDIVTGQGLITDVCLKRKVRDYVAEKHEMASPYDIYIRHGGNLQAIRQEALNAEKTVGKEHGLVAMCGRFFDVRAFGAVFPAAKAKQELNLGRLQGPVQFTAARSVGPINVIDMSISRVANENKDSEHGTFGDRAAVAYGLYVLYGSVSPALAQKSGFSDEDMELTTEAIMAMFSGADKSAGRSNVAVRWGAFFTHASKMGNAHYRRLWDFATPSLKPGVEIARSYADIIAPNFDAFDVSGVEMKVLTNF